MEKKYCVNAFLWLIISVLTMGSMNAQGMVLNEFSNGDSGTREYMEFVVVGPPANPNCGPVDLRGWIIDDNNGDFSCGPCSGTGIATGHIRLGAVPTWQAVPTGSIIVIYSDGSGNENLNMPAADPDDTFPADGVYIVPASSILVEVSTATSCGAGNIPAGATSCPGPCTGDSQYAGACYTIGGSWNNAGLRNDGDAAQVRMPDGSYFHGVGYGNASSDINGGPENLFISGTGGGDFFMFDNSTSDDFRNIANWSKAPVSSNGETPGAPNNAANASWIADLGTPCPLPVVYAQELTGAPSTGENVLTWATAIEVNADHFVIEKSTDPASGFSWLGEVEAYGNSSARRSYEFTDPQPAPFTWYRLRQVDMDGHENISAVATVQNGFAKGMSIQTWPSPVDNCLRFKVEGSQILSVELVDLTGRIVQAVVPTDNVSLVEGEFETAALESGLYLLRARRASSVATQRIVCQH